MDLLQGLTASLLVIVALVGSLAYLRRRGFAQFEMPRRGVRRLEALERLTLTPQHALHLVRVEDKILIVASAPGGCQVLGPIEPGIKTEL